MAAKPKPTLRPLYRVGELATLAGISRGRVLRTLHAVGIEVRWVGHQRLIFVSDIKAKMPALWRSIVACEQARLVARTVERIGR